MIDFAVLDAAQLLVVGEGKRGPRCGDEQSKIDLIAGGALVASEGTIVDVGRSAEIRERHDLANVKVIDAAGKVVMPGLIDPHTHPVFAGLRYDEYARLLGGATREEVIKAGGGIWKSVLQTRAADTEEL